jgi:arylesterase / paraoxonase
MGGKQDPYIGAGVALSVILFLLYGYPGFLSPTPSHFDGTCRTLPLSASAEDLRIDPSTGLVYLTYYDRVEEGHANRARQGSVMLLDLNAAEPRVRAALTAEFPGLSPSGLSLYSPANGPKRLFVMSFESGRGRHSIEIFEQTATGTFTHVESIQDELVWSPVSIVAVGPRQFYFTNDGRRPGRRKGGGLVYFDGEKMKQMAPRIDDALGVAVSPDGKKLYLAEARRGQMFVYDREIATGALKYSERVELPSMPHNLTVDSEGSVWIAAHPRGLAYSGSLRNAAIKSPTQVLKYTPGPERGGEERDVEEGSVEEIYVNGGEQLSAGSVAAARGNQLLIGSIADHKLLLCTRAGRALPSDFSGPEKDT